MNQHAKDQLMLGTHTREFILPSSKCSVFDSLGIRTAGFTSVKDQYVCTRLNPDHHTILLSVQGQGKLDWINDSGDVTLAANSVALLKKGNGFSYSAREWDFVWIILEPSCPYNSTIKRLESLLTTQYATEIMHIILLLYRQVSNPTRQQLGIELKTLLNQTLTMTAVTQSKQNKLNNLLSEMAMTLHRKWTTQQMADNLNMSKATLNRLCLNSYLKPASRLIHELKMERAADLLTHTQWDLNNIALQLGYSEACNFSRAFKKYFGLSPNFYRFESETPLITQTKSPSVSGKV